MPGKAISEHTKALAALRRAESGLVRPDPAGAVERMRVARKAQAAQFAGNVLPIIRDIQTAGHTSFNAIAGQLNARKVATANGGRWRHVQVRQILGRAKWQPFVKTYQQHAKTGASRADLTHRGHHRANRQIK